jgi:hypothetical protein
MAFRWIETRTGAYAFLRNGQRISAFHLRDGLYVPLVETPSKSDRAVVELDFDPNRTYSSLRDAQVAAYARAPQMEIDRV